MKKLAIGCLVVLALAGVTLAGLGYYAYRRVQSTVEQFAELAQVPEIERAVLVRDRFVPPPSEELHPSQIERLLRVQTAVRQRLGARFAEFEQKYKTLAAKEKATLSDLPTLLAAYRDMTVVWLDAKRSQVEALNEVKLSLDEYKWIRHQAYSALGIPYVDFDIGKLADDIRLRRTAIEPGQIRGAMGATGPEVNRKLVEPFKKQLEENVALASFGL